MKCYFCDTELSWDSEYDYSGISDDKEGIVVNLSCPKCDTTFICEQLKEKHQNKHTIYSDKIQYKHNILIENHDEI